MFHVLRSLSCVKAVRALIWSDKMLKIDKKKSYGIPDLYHIHLNLQV